MRLIDRLVGLRTPAPGTPPGEPAAVRRALMALDRPTAPYAVREARPGEDADLVAEWRVFEPAWAPVFERAGLAESLSILMWLRPAEREVRCLHWSRALRWRDGAAERSSGFKLTLGATASVAFGVAPAFVETLPDGTAIRYRFDATEVRRPLERAVTSQGWSWRGVGFDGTLTRLWRRGRVTP